MSTLITYSMEFGMPAIVIHAPSCNTVISSTDIGGYLVRIDGDSKVPFVIGVRFINCTIIAENLRAFDSCYFDQTCKMLVKSMPLCGVESINNNAVIIVDSESK